MAENNPTHGSINDHIVGGKREDLDQIAKHSTLPVDTAKRFLQNTTVSTLFPEGRTNIIGVQMNDPVSVVFKLLIQNKIQSVPVFNPQKQMFVAFIDILDIVSFLVRISREEEYQGISIDSEKFARTTCGQIADVSGRNMYYPIDENAPLLTLLHLMVHKKIHRVPVINMNNELVSVITQSHVLNLIFNNIDKFSNLQETVGNIQLGTKPVLTVHLQRSALDAFKIIYEKRVNGVAVVNDYNVLVGNVSASDLKQIGWDATFLTNLLLSVNEFLKMIHAEDDHEKAPFSVHSSSTIQEAITKLVLTRSHRIYAVDDENHPCGNISLVDILEFISKQL